MKKPLKIVLITSVSALIAFSGVAVFIGSVDADKYRPQLAEMLSEKTGRTVKLAGPIAFSLGLSGVRILIEDAAIANPPGASRPLMVRMGKLDLGIGLGPLLRKRLSIDNLSIENADILLETNAAGQKNWDFAARPPVAKAEEGPQKDKAPTVSLSIHKLKIINSQLVMRSADGKRNAINVAALDLGMRGTGAELIVSGDIDGTSIRADMKTSLMDLLSRDPFTLDADVTLGNIHGALLGKIDLANDRADISAYEASAGNTKITGDMDVAWGGARPSLRGSLRSDRLNLADFKLDVVASDDAEASTPKKTTAKGPLFSDARLPLDAMKALDVDLNVALGALLLGDGKIEQIESKLTLANGTLSFFPTKAKLGPAPLDIKFAFYGARAPAHVDISLKVKDADFADFLELASIPAFITGKADASLQLAGDGDSPHGLVSSLVGLMTLTAEKGKILSSAAAQVSSLLAAVMGSSDSDNALNCLAARFIVRDGVWADNGILVDSATAAIAGKGEINLGGETIKMVLRAKPKLVDVGGLIPALQITGKLADPDMSVNASGMVKDVVGGLLTGNASALTSGIPDIQQAPAGQNACVYTLDHPQKAESSTSVVPTKTLSTTGKKIQDFGNSLMKGLLGK